MFSFGENGATGPREQRGYRKKFENAKNRPKFTLKDGNKRTHGCKSTIFQVAGFTQCYGNQYYLVGSWVKQHSCTGLFDLILKLKLLHQGKLKKLKMESYVQVNGYQKGVLQKNPDWPWCCMQNQKWIWLGYEDNQAIWRANLRMGNGFFSTWKHSYIDCGENRVPRKNQYGLESKDDWGNDVHPWADIFAVSIRCITDKLDTE